MLEFLGISALIIILYNRTYKYYKMIDDPVPRENYLWVIPTIQESPTFYDTKRSIMYTVTNIGTFIATCLAIQMCFGWKVALLYAVMPTNVGGVAWATGNYYMTTVLLVMTAYYFDITFAWGVLPAMVFYFAAMHSTVSAIPYFFYMIIAHSGASSCLHLIPLVSFLCGKRFRYGLKLRQEGHKKIGVTAGVVRTRHFFVMIKVIGYYIALNLFPSRLGFFHHYGKDEYEVQRLPCPTRLFWVSLGVVVAFSYWGWTVDPKMCLWWFLFIGIFSQFVVFGQFIAERYLHIANVGFCVLIATFLEPYPIAYAILATLWTYRTHLYIPAWKHNRNLFAYSISAFPEAPENYNNLSSYYLQKNQPHKAIEPLMLVIRYGHGNKDKNWANLGHAYLKINLFDKAHHCFEEALKLTQEEKLALSMKELISKINQKKVKFNRLQKELGGLRDD